MIVVATGEELARALNAASIEIGLEHGMRVTPFAQLPPRQQQMLIDAAALALRRIGMANEHGRQPAGRPPKAKAAAAR